MNAPGKDLDAVFEEVRRIGRVLAEISVERREQSRLVRAELILRARRRRDAVFGPGLFGEPAFDILLDLFVAARAGKQVSISSACIAAAVPPTTALRHLGLLEQRGLIARRADPLDRRRSFLTLTDQAGAAMEQFLDGAF